MDDEQFAVAAAGLHGRVSRAVLAMCGDRALAEESAQEALVRAWQRVDDGEPLRSLDAWTITVAFNWCRSQLRRAGAEQRAMERLPLPPARTDQENVSSQLVDDVHRAVLERRSR